MTFYSRGSVYIRLAFCCERRRIFFLSKEEEDAHAYDDDCPFVKAHWLGEQMTSEKYPELLFT